MNKKILSSIIMGIMLLISVIGGLFLLKYRKDQAKQSQLVMPVSNVQQPISSSNPTGISETLDSKSGSMNQSDTDALEAEKDITNQPSYLIAAYSKDGKNYIDVDFVEWLHGEASIKEQMDDGRCPSLNECYDYPNGYKQNKDPQVRTFEVSPNAKIEVNGEIAAKLNEINQTRLGDPYGGKLSISFSELEKAVSKTTLNLDYSQPFKEPKAFITINIKDNLVNNIIEPFQE